MSKVIGIDLGTTNSVAAVMEGGMPVVIPNAEGDRLTPSVVAFGRNGERLVGRMAKRQATVNPEETIFSVKRLMGCKLADDTVQQDRTLPYRLAAAPNGDVRMVVDGREYSPPEISAMILQKLKQDAEMYLGQAVTRAVISVPAYFNDCQRQATKEAGRIAGLDVLRILNEPTASALAYDFPPERRETIVVYDLGGGTFDISILDLCVGVFEVLSTNGDTHLGGNDFDARIVEWLCNEFEREEGMDLRENKEALQRVKEAAEDAKIELSSRLLAEISLPYIAQGPRGSKHLNVILTRDRMEQLVEDLIERTVAPCRQAMTDAGLKTLDIDEVILVGGQTRMPAVQKKVHEIFGKFLLSDVNPEEAVGLGAGIQAGALIGEVKNILLIDVTPLTLGIETRGGVASPLIRRNTTIPVRKSQIFTTAQDDQTSVEIVVVQGERVMAVENTVLGRFTLDDIPPAARGEAKIEVTFKLDADGILQVTAQDQATGKEQHITVTASSGLSEEELEQMGAETREHDERDQQRRLVIKTRNRADSMAYEAEKMLEQHGEELPDELREDVRDKVLAVRQALGLDDVGALEQAMRDLAEVTQRVVTLDLSASRSVGGAGF